LAAAFLAWRILSFGISQVYVGQAAEGDAAAVDRALAWDARHPDALYRRAQAVREEDPAAASALLRRSFAGNPTSALPLLALAGLALNAGDESKAAELVEASEKLMPANPAIQIAAGGYWAGRGKMEAAMARWSQALDASREASAELFPILLKLAAEPQTVGLFKSVAASPPTWWERFFQTTAQRALDLETVRTLYAFRRATKGAQLTQEERDSYVRRLQREGKITEAFLVWVNGLDEAGRAHLGILNNGNFEIEPTNTGFDWHLRATDRATARTGTTAGMEGEKALHLIFKRREKPYRHVHQPLFLDPGTYRVDGMVRTDSLVSKGGLKWVVRCLLPNREDLGESERFLGSSEWREFSFEVRVPQECAAQQIRLVSAGKREFEHKINGAAWFDGMSMRRVPAPIIQAGSSTSHGTAAGAPIAPAPVWQYNLLDGAQAPVFDFGPSLLESLDGTEH
jgi:tetratricopeptide (TPR) repeat protein